MYEDLEKDGYNYLFKKILKKELIEIYPTHEIGDMVYIREDGTDVYIKEKKGGIKIFSSYKFYSPLKKAVRDITKGIITPPILNRSLFENVWNIIQKGLIESGKEFRLFYESDNIIVEIVHDEKFRGLFVFLWGQKYPILYIHPTKLHIGSMRKGKIDDSLISKTDDLSDAIINSYLYNVKMSYNIEELFNNKKGDGKVNKKGPFFGCEIELEFDGEQNAPTLSKIFNEFYDWDGNVVEDGSLGKCGKEFVSGIYENLDFVMELHQDIKKFSEYHHLGLKYPSPCALHIHCSNIKGVIQLFLLYTAFYEFFEELLINHENKLVHNRLVMPGWHVLKRAFKEPFEVDIEDLDSSQEELFGDISRKLGYLFQNVRRSTLRYSGLDSPLKTIEFRPFPMKEDDEIINLYVKIVKKSLDLCAKLGVKEAYIMSMNLQTMYFNDHEKYINECCSLLDMNNKDFDKVMNR